MKVTIKLPKGAVSMQEGQIAAWYVKSGDTVSKGQHIYDLESEKSTMEMESPFDGTIEILANVGQTLQVGDPIATINT